MLAEEKDSWFRDKRLFRFTEQQVTGKSACFCPFGCLRVPQEWSNTCPNGRWGLLLRLRNPDCAESKPALCSRGRCYLIYSSRLYAGNPDLSVMSDKELLEPYIPGTYSNVCKNTRDPWRNVFSQKILL